MTANDETLSGNKMLVPSDVECLRAEVADWKQAASVEASLRREFHDKLEIANAIAAYKTRAWNDIVAERTRQRSMEGYDDSHDDAHEDFALSSAAIAYLRETVARGSGETSFKRPPEEWPWAPADWKPKDIRRNLVIAAALVVAEIERLDRSEDSNAQI